MKSALTQALFFGACATTAIGLLACGEDSSTSPSGSGANSAGESISSSYQLLIDENSQTMKLSGQGDFENKCLVNNGVPQWGSVKIRSGEQLVQYKFVGDTLVLSWWDDEDDEFNNLAKMYVGGKAGSIYSTWTSIPCTYKLSSERTNCDDDDIEATEIVSITSNSFSKTVTAQYIEETNRKFNYATSDYRYKLFAYLVTGNASYIPLPDYIFGKAVTIGDEYVKQNGNIVSYAELYANYPLSERISMGLHSTEELATFSGIVSTDLSATGETFTYGGISYTVSVLKAIDTDEHTSITVTIATNGITCTNIDESNRHITQDLCKSENMEYLKTDDDTDVNGNKYYYGYKYSQNNFSDFKACLNTILVPQPVVQ